MDVVVLSVAMDVFEEHLAAASVPLPSSGVSQPSLCATSTHLTPQEEQMLLRSFARVSAGTQCCSMDALRALLQSVVRIASPVGDDTFNTALGFTPSKKEYTWEEVRKSVTTARLQAGTFRADENPTIGRATAETGSSRWSAMAEHLFRCLLRDPTSPIVDTEDAIELLVRLLPNQKTLAVRQGEVIRALVPNQMTLEEFEKVLMAPLRTLLLKEPRPRGTQTSSSGVRHVASMGFQAFHDVVESKRDTSSLNSTIASISDRTSRAKKVRDWVVKDPKGYFGVAPCAMRQTELWHLQRLRQPLIRRFVVRMKRSFAKHRPAENVLRMVRALERADDLCVKHTDHCDRCQWFEDAAAKGSPQKSPRKRTTSSSTTPRRTRPSHDDAPTFSPRICALPRTPRNPAPLQVNESLMVLNIFRKAQDAKLM